VKRTCGIHELAKKMLAEGYRGQEMEDPERAEKYILLAAADPNVERGLPIRGFGFWDACHFNYRVWKARQKLESAA
jgi:hypothetical protein